MKLIDLSVRRPVTITMIFLGVVILGVISWVRLPQELFPSIAYPQITIVTSYENAAPEEIESLITKIIEETVGTVNNVKRINSVSKEGLSMVMIEFNWGTNMDFAALSVREKIDLIKEKLPREANDPIVMKYNPFELPIMNLAITGPLSEVEMRETTRKYVKEAIEKIEGVASANITGGNEKEIIVQIDQARLQASQLSIVTIVDSLKATNINYPAGTIKESVYEYLIRTIGEFQTTEEISETPIALDLPEEDKKRPQDDDDDGRKRLIYLRDIAEIVESVKERTSLSRYNAKNSISLVIRKQSGANTLKTAELIKAEIKELLEERLPKGITIQITYDQSLFIKESISNLKNAAIQGGILAFLALFFFLRDLRSSIVIIFSVPISLMATFCLMYFTNVNINMMSLGGLALGVGMLVDNSVVVIENIFRHRQTKTNLKEACVKGAGEMVAPIVGSTLTTVAVFFPFAFVVGIAGQIFKQLSFTIVFSLLTSIVVAITLIPVLMSMGKKSGSVPFLSRIIPEFTFHESKALASFLSFFLNKRKLVIAVAIVIFLISLKALGFTEKRFLPQVDQRQFIIKVDLAPGTRLEVTDSVVKNFERVLLQLPEAKDITVNIGSSEERASLEETALKILGSHQAQIMVNLKKLNPKKGMKRPTQEVIQGIKDSLAGAQLQNAQIEYIAEETSLGAAFERSAPIVIEVRGPELSKLTLIASEIFKELNYLEGLFGLKTSMIAPSPETKLRILKDKSSLYGLSVRDIAITSQVALKGYVATQFKVKEEGKDVDIRVQLRPEDRQNLANLRRLLIRSPLGFMVPLSEVAYLVQGTGPTEIKRIDQQKSVLVTANIFGKSLREIVGGVQGVLDQLGQDFAKEKDYSMELKGEQERMKESFTSLAFALTLAIILVYMIMASEFESLWQPFLIMFTVPLSLVGVVVTLFITQTPLSIVVYLGIIMLGGIVVNNGIVLIDLINNLTKQGMPDYEAVIKACQIRMRPILITSSTTILGMFPLALGIGEGAELRAPLAIAVIGGLISATFLTIIVLPCLYLEFAKRIPKPQPIPAVEPPAPQIITPRAAAPEIPEPKIERPKIEEVPSVPQAKEPRIEETPPAPRPKPIKPQEPTPKLNLRQEEFLKKLKTLKKMSRKEYADTFGISTPTAARDLKDLVKKGLVVAKGPLGPGRWYELTKDNP